MINELKEFTQLGGTVFTVIAFLIYLKQKDEMNKRTYEEFNETIKNHLDHSTKVIEKNSQALANITIAIKQLCWQIKKNGKR